ncbi:tunicamycin resistance protein [Polyrhizophydium stewartii]|uniref:UDP-N-acetylglucosamine--dolichyl-phosphate N-acetylglucosaminephosphotransferase n=1 Tax=Polyrhizophydium stewartii TaxID=2732419 RepID=A0ABR4N229_9FUNG
MQDTLKSAALPGTLLALGASFAHEPLVVSVLLGALAGVFTDRCIPLVAPVFVRAGRFGKDLLKKDRPVIAESLGVVVGVVYFISMFLFIPIPFVESLLRGDRDSFPHDEAGFRGSASVCPSGATADTVRALVQFVPYLAQFLGGLLALFAMLFLGFADDVFDIRWRVKIWFPFIASIPLLMVYFVTYGKTDVVVPIPLRPLLGRTTLHLGVLYYVYIAALCVFSTNAINIMAGANGVEGGQSLVIAASLAANDLMQLRYNPSRRAAHLLSLYFLIPFICVTLGYLRHNWYPARAFGGDTLAYFSGMTFAVVGVLSNLSKTVLLFMIPQIFNFLYSCPQLFHFVECPRHRMPKLNLETGKVEATRFSLEKSKALGRLMVRFLEVFGLVHVTRDKTGKMVDCTNLTIMNLILFWRGPMSERDLVLHIMLVQVMCSVIAFVIRYGLVHIVYNQE